MAAARRLRPSWSCHSEWATSATIRIVPPIRLFTRRHFVEDHPHPDRRQHRLQQIEHGDLRAGNITRAGGQAEERQRRDHGAVEDDPPGSVHVKPGLADHDDGDGEREDHPDQRGEAHVLRRWSGRR